MSYLKFLSNGSCLNYAAHNTAAFIEMDSEVILIDCGTTVFGDLLANNMLDKNFTVIITHTHADHVGSLVNLIYAKAYTHRGRHVKVITAVSNLKQLLDLQGVDEQMYELITCNANVWCKICEGIQVMPIEVLHSPNLESYGYAILYTDTMLWYSGDAKDIPDRVLDSFMKGDIKYIYQDTTLKENTIHMSDTTLTRKIPKEERSRVYPIHLDARASTYLSMSGFNTVEPLYPPNNI